MDALAGLDEIAEQTSCRIDVGTRQRQTKCKWGHAVPANLTHSKVAREKKAPPAAAKLLPKPIPKKPAPAPPVAPARLGQAFTTYRTLVETFRQRAVEMELSRSEIDRIAGLPSGYAGKILSTGKAKNPKRMGMISLENMLATLGLKIILIEDDAATARTLALRSKPVDASQQRFGNHSRSGSVVALPAPEQSRAKVAVA
jgi:hypothetical protein